MRYRTGIIGCGNMGGAIVHGLMRKRLLSPGQVWVSDVDTRRTRVLVRRYGVRTACCNQELVDACRVILLAVKPQQLPAVLGGFSMPGGHRCVVSVAAGVNLASLRKMLGRNAGLVRVMPNTPALISEGMTALCRGSGVTKGEWDFVASIFSCLGNVRTVPERKMGIVTALSGSGPAYFFYLIEGLAEAGVRHGLTRAEALALASQTAWGSAKLLVRSGVSPAELRARVTSKGGTTEAALRVFEKKGFKKILDEGVGAALCRSRELERGRK